MCLVVFAWRHQTGQRIALAGNRDEFHGRPTAALHWWAAPPILAGRDLEAGGTWLGIDRRGRFGVVTNFRGGAAPTAAPSRGALIPAFLADERTPLAFLDAVAGECERYAGFSLLLGDEQSLAYFCNRDGLAPRALPPGVYGLSNGTLDAPWPKLLGSRASLERALSTGASGAEALLATVADRREAPDERLPDTGVGLELERRLSAAFIVGADYGTRSSTALVLDEAGRGEVVERSYGTDGTPSALQRFALAPRR